MLEPLLALIYLSDLSHMTENYVLYYADEFAICNLLRPYSAVVHVIQEQCRRVESRGEQGTFVQKLVKSRLLLYSLNEGKNVE